MKIEQNAEIEKNFKIPFMVLSPNTKLLGKI